MKLLLDMGNSRLKWAWSSAEGLVRAGCATHRGRDLSAVLTELLGGSDCPDEVRVANVAGSAAGAMIAEAVHVRFGLGPVFACSPDMACGITNGYRDPSQLGVDRWLAMCAAWQMFPGPLCVVDAGTAVTIDVMAADGIHSGGLILPGIALMATALRQQTGDLNRVAGPALSQGMLIAGAQDRYSLGSDTASAIRLGAVRSIAALVADCLASRNGTGEGMKLMITGGDGAQLAQVLDAPGTWCPNLVLEGLAIEPPCYSVV